MSKEPLAYEPAKWEIADVVAIQACADGTADATQQKRVINWLIHNAACTDDVDYRTNEREHVFTSGRRFVGLQLRKLIGLNVAAIQQSKGSQ